MPTWLEMAEDKDLLPTAKPRKTLALVNVFLVDPIVLLVAKDREIVKPDGATAVSQTAPRRAQGWLVGTSIMCMSTVFFNRCAWQTHIVTSRLQQFPRDRQTPCRSSAYSCSEYQYN